MLDTENGPQIGADATIQQPTDADATANVTRTRRSASRPAGPPNAPTAKKGAAKKAAQTKEQTKAKTQARTDKTATDQATTGGTSTETRIPPTSATKKSATKKSATKKSATKESATKKSATKKSAAKKSSAKRSSQKTAETVAAPLAEVDPAPEVAVDPAPVAPVEQSGSVTVVFQPPDPEKQTRLPADKDTTTQPAQDVSRDQVAPAEADNGGQPDSDTEGGGTRRRRRRGGRRRRKPSGETATSEGSADDASDETAGESAQATGVPMEVSTDTEAVAEEAESTTTSRRRRRRRRRADEDFEPSAEDPADTVVRVRAPRETAVEIVGLDGSTRLEAKKQRRREGRAAGRRRTPIVSEAEFLARRESVERVMVVRQRAGIIQIAVLEDNVLVEHYVSRESQTSLIGNVYLGRVQNVLPSMEAAFIDIGKGRNAVLYAGEVNWDLLGEQGQPRKIESVLKSGQTVLVQVSKDPVGHKGARLTSQISLAGRYLVYVPGGGGNGISRKLPDTERTRLKSLLKEILPEEAGVIIRTAAEGTSEEELTRDVNRLTARWEDIEKKAAGAQAPQLLYGEPDLMIKVVRDLFTEDFVKLVVSGDDDAWDTVHGYVAHVAPELSDRLERWEGDDDVLASYRIDEQIAKALDRKVFLPSGGSLVIDRTEAMTVVDVNTGKFTGSGGNLEETVTKNNLEAAEEIVRQLRLRDIGGIIVIDFIDMVLESNRELVLRRMVECLGRDRTKHQVAEVTSLGLVQMTRKRIGTGLLEAFSRPCEYCAGRGLIIEHEPIPLDQAKKPKTPKSVDKKKKPKSDKTAKTPKKSKSSKTAMALRQPETDGTPESPVVDSIDEAASPLAGTPARSLLDRVEDDLPPAVTPRKRTRKRVTRPAGQPTPTS